MVALGGCQKGTEEPLPSEMPVRFAAEYPGASRVSGSSFESGDRIGVFMTKAAEPLQASGNRLNNEAVDYDGTAWTTERTLYWDEGTFNVYAYYPYDEGLRVVDDIPFSVATNQRAMVEGTGMDGYEASDFLWASNPNVAASEEPVTLTFSHRMSKLVVRIVKGESYTGDLPEEMRVYVHNTVPDATIDLSVGLVTKDAYASARTIEAKEVGTGEYTAIVVPQRLDNQVPLVEIVTEGVSYLVERKFVFKQGIQHTMTITLEKNPEQIKIDIGGEIEVWDETDEKV